MNEISPELKAEYSAQAARRRANAIKRGELRLRIEEKALDAFLEFWTTWVAVLGKEEATDNLIEAMIEQHFRIKARIEYAGKLNRPKKNK